MAKRAGEGGKSSRRNSDVADSIDTDSANGKGSDAEIKPSLWELAKMPNSDGLWEKDDLFTVLHWIRQVIGIVFGVIFGLIPLTGFIGNITFISTVSAICYLYYAKYLAIDEEEFGRFELLSEGFMNAYALFLVSWTTTYSIVQV
eukprot:TRINITY_DN1869_c0_g1_i1.p1 TRINITY_DN1869_c0_g1~~TRINITY_DN1869_c0_g1_i1.p1  ORF type:complete len:167 (-),score=49.13 TRINITY_DN1869_c0_g1_i1:46-480(-)